MFQPTKLKLTSPSSTSIFLITYTFSLCLSLRLSLSLPMSLSVFWLEIHFLVLLAAVKTQKKYICCSVTQLYQTPCDPMDCSTSGLPVHHQLLELTQTNVH